MAMTKRIPGYHGSGKVGGYMDGQTDERTDERTDGRMDGQMDRMDRCIDEYLFR